MEDYLKVNKASWDERADKHYDSEFYDNDSFIEGRNSIPTIDLELLGNIKNKSIIHLQCHFGQDTISLSRLGAIATGLDFSESAIDKAKKLASLCGTDTEFICSDVYAASEKVNSKFDITYTSYGTIGWLPEINKWAETVSNLTVKGGKFILVEFHPTVWMFDDGLNYVQYSYFNSEPIVEVIQGSYADQNNKSTYHTISWNHGLAEVVQALINQGFQLDVFKEYPFSPYNVFPGMTEIGPNKFIVEKFGEKMPLVYALSMTKI